MSSALDCKAQQCSNCSKTASHTCKACKAMPNATDGKLSSVWYCGADCQKAHWTVHKVECKATQTRQALYRAGALAQQIFYLYCKTTYTATPGRIEKIGTTWLIHPAVYTGTSQLIAFPYAIFPDVHEQEALLAQQSCGTAVSELHNVVKVLFRGLYSKIDEVNYRFKGASHLLRQVYVIEGTPSIDSSDYTHLIMRVTMQNGETYALDIAGAQYGWYDSVIPWSLYNTSRIREIQHVFAFGEVKVLCETSANNAGGQHKWVHIIRKTFSVCVDDAVAMWQKSNGSLRDLLRLPEDEFQMRKASFLDWVDHQMQHYKAYAESSGDFEVKEGFQFGSANREFTSPVGRMSAPEAVAFFNKGLAAGSLINESS